ncbi:MAG: glycosyltransferase family 2 protein [Phycisphaerae bacterium]|nr:glycosyltransferase family 2 protein [Phycisphaerae bacterium]
MDYPKTAVIIPAFRVADTICDVVLSLPGWVETIIVVDDACPAHSGKIAESLHHSKVLVIYHEQNLGVGGAVQTGYRKALEMGCNIMVKVDGDGQMDPRYIPALIAPLVHGEVDYAKGNRFWDFSALRAMPKMRLLGNNFLSFLEKMFSGYWHIMDPTNGFTALHQRAARRLNLNKISKGYFFESDMLLHLNLSGAVVRDVPIPARYGDEISSLSIRKVLIQFPPRLLYGLMKRIFFNYFIYDFNMASVYLVTGIPLFLWGVLFGLYQWIDSVAAGTPKTAGTIMLAALPLILALEMLLQAVNIDIQRSQQNLTRRTSLEDEVDGMD